MHYHSAIWLLSDGRSGSTWFAQLLNFSRAFHLEHEPVHALFNPRLGGEALLPMPSSRAIDTLYTPLFADILGGNYITNRFGEAGERATGDGGIIIRDIFALLIAPRILATFPQIRPLVIVRHPTEVALSKLALSDWAWFTEVDRFAADEILCATFPDLAWHIARAESPFQKYVLGWAVCHGFFFSRVERGAVTVVRYPSPRATMAAKVESILMGSCENWRTGLPEFDAAWERRSATDRPPAETGLFAKVLRPDRASLAERAWAEAVIDSFGLRWLVS